MRRIVFVLYLISSTFISFSQQATVKAINEIITQDAALEPFMFLASDELMGRSPKRPEIHIAARYISEKFKSFGLKALDSTTDYFQTFEIKFSTPANKGSLTINHSTYNIGNELLQIAGTDVSLKTAIVFTYYSSKEDLDKVDVKGKIVVTNFGRNDSSSIYEGFSSMKAKQQLIKEKGAVAIIERIWQTQVPWHDLQAYFSQERIVQDETSFPVFIINGSDSNFISLIKNGPEATVQTSGNEVKIMPAKNVMGWIEGTDPKLKDQFIVLSAHYDHIGVSKQPKMEEGKLDSIFNGARDNAIGVTAVLNAAKYFTKYPPKRSVLFIAYTAEEMGLVGSRYFAEHATIPLNKLVYNLNIDNASYNDTTLVTVIGLGRTSADNDIKKAAAVYGLKAAPDPAPEQNLFDRSDNVSLAAKGIPAPTYSLGVAKFDSSIMNRYHQLSDEVGNFNLRYALKYVRSFVLAAKNIADNPVHPAWIKNDKYEAAWKKLYTGNKGE